MPDKDRVAVRVSGVDVLLQQGVSTLQGHSDTLGEEARHITMADSGVHRGPQSQVTGGNLIEVKTYPIKLSFKWS